MQPLDLLFISLGTWYVSYAVTKTHGPFKVFETLRARLPLGGLTACIVCLALWVGIALTIAIIYVPVVVLPFAGAGGAMLLHRYTGGDHI